MRAPAGPSPATHFDAVLFDLDGTLVDSAPDIAHAAHAVRAACGLAPLSEARIRSFIGDGAPRLVARTLADSHDPDIDEETFERGYAIFRQAYLACLCDRTRPFPGTIDALSTLRGLGMRLAVVTNKPLEFTLPILDGLGLTRYFEVVLGGDSLPTKKPDPEPLLHAAARLRSAPARTLMVGDSRNDLLAAKAAGCPSVMVSYGYGFHEPRPEGCDPVLIADSLVELAPLIDQRAHD